MNPKVLFILILCSSCNSHFYITDQGGIRPKSNSSFVFKKRGSIASDTLYIDTNAIYLRPDIITHNKGRAINLIPATYYRFFVNGKVQEVRLSNRDINQQVNITQISHDINQQVNNTQIGHVGFYKIIGHGKILIQIMTERNRGEVIFKNGFFRNGDLYIFEINETPPDWYDDIIPIPSFKGINNKNIYAKTKVDSLKSVELKW